MTAVAGTVSLHPLAWGLAAGTGIMAFYLGLSRLAADWFYAKAQFGDYRRWLIALAAGLDDQAALYAGAYQGPTSLNYTL